MSGDQRQGGGVRPSSGNSVIVAVAAAPAITLRTGHAVIRVAHQPAGKGASSGPGEENGEGLELSATRSRWASVKSSAIDGSTSTTATPKTISTPVSVALGAAASAIVSFSGRR